MSDHNQPIPMHFPVMPYGYPPYPVVRERPRDDQIPPRVEVAMAFLMTLVDKAEPLVAVGYPGSVEAGEIKVVPGQDLTLRETDTQSAALNLLTQYFNGQLGMTDLEKEEAEDRKRSSRRRSNGYTTACPKCQTQRGDMTCHLCAGLGFINVTPAKKPGRRTD